MPSNNFLSDCFIRSTRRQLASQALESARMAITDLERTLKLVIERYDAVKARLGDDHERVLLLKQAIETTSANLNEYCDSLRQISPAPETGLL